jgi:hypothetical protein
MLKTHAGAVLTGKREITAHVGGQPLAADLLTGTKAIAAHVGMAERRVIYLLSTGRLPGFRVGRRWHARCSELDRALSAGGAA